MPTNNTPIDNNGASTLVRAKVKKVLKWLFSVGLAAVLFAFVYRKFNFSELWSYMKSGQIRYDWLLFSVVIEASANIFRGLRWRLQALPLSRQPLRRSTFIYSTLGCYSLNVVLPRAGEVWRCVVTARKERLSLSSVLGTLITDRLMDLVVMLLLLVIAVSCFFADTQQLFQHIHLSAGFLYTLFVSPWFYVGVGCFILFAWLLRKRILASALGNKIKRFVKELVSGLFTIAHMPHKWLFVLYTAVLWGMYYLSFYMSFWAFPFTAHLPIGVSVLAFIMGTIGVAVPVQAGIGPWHFMVITTLVAFGVASEAAGSFALLVHTTHTIGVALAGVLAIFFISLLKSNKNHL